MEGSTLRLEILGASRLVAGATAISSRIADGPVEPAALASGPGPVVGAAATPAAIRTLTPTQLALLAYLAVGAGGAAVRRDTLLGLFWPEHDPERARNALRQHLHQLRAVLGSGVLSQGTQEVALTPGRLSCDAAELELAARMGDHRTVLALYRGDLLPGLFLPASTEFEGWLERTRTRYRDMAVRSAWALAEKALAERVGADEAPADAGHGTTTAGGWARRAATLARFEEPGVRRAMRIMADEGDRAGALQLYALLARHLACDLDLAPSPETARLAEEIRGPRSDASPQPLTITTALSDTARAADLPLVSPSGLPAAPARPMTMPPGRARARSRRLAAALALLAVPVVGAIVARSDLGTRRPRIVIEPLANMSADTSLDTFARLATQRIESSLQPLPVEEVATAMSLGGGRSLARALRASFLVSGVVTARGDTIRVATTVTDLRTGQVARHGRVVAAPAGASLELLPPLQTEVHGIVSSLLRAPR